MVELPTDTWCHEILPRAWTMNSYPLARVCRLFRDYVRSRLPEEWAAFPPAFALPMMRLGWHMRPKVLALLGRRYQCEVDEDGTVRHMVRIDNWSISYSIGRKGQGWNATHETTAHVRRGRTGAGWRILPPAFVSLSSMANRLRMIHERVTRNKYGHVERRTSRPCPAPIWRFHHEIFPGMDIV